MRWQLFKKFESAMKCCRRNAIAGRTGPANLTLRHEGNGPGPHHTRLDTSSAPVDPGTRLRGRFLLPPLILRAPMPLVEQRRLGAKNPQQSYAPQGGFFKV